MTDTTDEAEQKAARGAMKQAIGLIVGDRKAESDGAKDKAAAERQASSGRKRGTTAGGKR